MASDGNDPGSLSFSSDDDGAGKRASGRGSMGASRTTANSRLGGSMGALNVAKGRTATSVAPASASASASASARAGAGVTTHSRALAGAGGSMTALAAATVAQEAAAAAASKAAAAAATAAAAADEAERSDAWALAPEQASKQSSLVSRVVDEHLWLTQPGIRTPEHIRAALAAEAEEAIELERDRATVSLFRAHLAESDSLCKAMVGVLDQAATRLADVEARVLPVHEVIAELQEKNAAHDALIAAVRGMLRVYATPQTVRRALMDGARLERYQPTLDAIEAIQDARDVFAANKTLNNRAAMSEQLVKSMHKAIDNLSKLFEQTGAQLCARPRELRLAATTPAIAAPTLSALTAISRTLTGYHVHAPLDSFVARRAEFLAASIRACVSPAEAKAAASAPPMAHLSRSSSAVRSHAVIVRWYTRGSLPLLALLEPFLCALADERAIATALISARESFDRLFHRVIEPALALFFGMGRAQLQSKAFDEQGMTALAALDLLDVLTTSAKRFRALLRCAMSKRLVTTAFDAAYHDLGEYFDRWIPGFVDEVRSHSTKSVPPDATVHQHVANTVGYLKSLLEYRAVLEHKLPSAPDGEAGSTSEFVARVLAALELNVADMAKSLKPHPARRAVFTLNNMHFIVKALEGPELAPETTRALTRHFADARDRSREQLIAAWDAVIGPLLEANRGGTTASAAAAAAAAGREISKAERDLIRGRFTAFNSEFDSLYDVCQTCLVPDQDLRAAVRAEARERVLPLYASFLARYKDVPLSSSGANTKYIRYTSETLADMIGRCFSGAR